MKVRKIFWISVTAEVVTARWHGPTTTSSSTESGTPPLTSSPPFERLAVQRQETIPLNWCGFVAGETGENHIMDSSLKHLLIV